MLLLAIATVVSAQPPGTEQYIDLTYIDPYYFGNDGHDCIYFDSDYDYYCGNYGRCQASWIQKPKYCQFHCGFDSYTGEYIICEAHIKWN